MCLNPRAVGLEKGSWVWMVPIRLCIHQLSYGVPRMQKARETSKRCSRSERSNEGRLIPPKAAPTEQFHGKGLRDPGSFRRTSWRSRPSSQENLAAASQHLGRILVGFSRIQFCTIFLPAALHRFDFNIPKNVQFLKTWGCRGGVCDIKYLWLYLYLDLR